MLKKYALPGSLESIREFLASFPPEETYRAGSIYDCVLAQYALSLDDYANADIKHGSPYLYTQYMMKEVYPKEYIHYDAVISFGTPSNDLYTFGAALARVDALIAERAARMDYLG